MSNSDFNGGILATLLFIGTIASWIGSGTVAWNWVEPDSFGGAIIFLIAWGILGVIFDAVVALIIGIVAGGVK